MIFMLIPVVLGSTYCFTDVHVRGLMGVGDTPITKIKTKGNSAQIFWGMRLFPRTLTFDFCYDLDICSQS